MDHTNMFVVSQMFEVYSVVLKGSEILNLLTGRVSQKRPKYQKYDIMTSSLRFKYPKWRGIVGTYVFIVPKICKVPGFTFKGQEVFSLFTGRFSQKRSKSQKYDIMTSSMGSNIQTEEKWFTHTCFSCQKCVKYIV